MAGPVEASQRSGGQPAPDTRAPIAVPNVRAAALIATVTSLFWLLVLGFVLLYWDRPEPAVFEIQPPVVTATPLPTPTQPPVVVDVAGAVLHPGVYPLPPGSRVQDAVAAAGGATAEANLRSISLARLLQDGEKLIVPAQGEPVPSASAPLLLEKLSGSVPLDGAQVNINTATWEELQVLPGIGPKMADAILAYRDANGPFPTIESIVEVKGIGEGILAKIRHLIVVE